MGQPTVFHLITRLARGGAEAKIIKTVSGLDNYDFIIGHGKEYDAKQVERLEEDDVSTVRFNLIRHYNLATAVPAVASVATYLRREQPDIVHTHSTEAGIIGRFAAAVADVPAIVHTVHGVPFTSDRSRALNRFVLACERQAAGLSDQIVTNGDAITDEYLSLEIGQPGQYVTVYSGICLEDFRTAKPADLPGNPPYVTMIGRLVDGKGFDILLEAVDRLSDQSFSVCLVGDGRLAESLKTKIAEMGLDDTVSLLGYREDVPAVLAASDILALPSFREGTPRVVTEAMAVGLPVVATNIAGVPEQITHGESGYLVPTGDPEALADHIARLLRHPDMRATYGAAAQVRAQRFSVGRMLKDLDDIYQSVLRTNR